ncbi:hypothetical protein [Pseudomonas sp. ITA]|uniref:hypothetical protein n=1 Tax=Pseudomonas sp. ITA TaxID=2825841 RepID=UPI0032B73A84
MPGNQTRQYAFADTIASDDGGWRLIELQIECIENRLAIGELETQLIQGYEGRRTRDVSHRHLQKMSGTLTSAFEGVSRLHF